MKGESAGHSLPLAQPNDSDSSEPEAAGHAAALQGLPRLVNSLVPGTQPNHLTFALFPGQLRSKDPPKGSILLDWDPKSVFGAAQRQWSSSAKHLPYAEGGRRGDSASGGPGTALEGGAAGSLLAPRTSQRP